MNLLNVAKLFLYCFCNPEDFKDSEKCRAFVKQVLAVAKTISIKNQITIDEKIIEQLETIVANTEIWNYCYNLVSGWLGNRENDQTDADGNPIFAPEGVAGLATFVPLLIQIWRLIRMFKKIKIED